LSNIGFASNYKNLIEKAKIAEDAELINTLNQLIVGLDLEISFFNDCIVELKKEKKWKKNCQKLSSRDEGIQNLIEFFKTANVNQRLFDIADKLDKGENLTYIDKIELSQIMEDTRNKTKEAKTLTSIIKFLEDNL